MLFWFVSKKLELNLHIRMNGDFNVGERERETKLKFYLSDCCVVLIRN